MARPLRITYPGAFYHATSRGNEGKVIFRNKRDRQKFLDYFESATQRYDAVIHVFCLMDTHYISFKSSDSAIPNNFKVLIRLYLKRACNQHNFLHSITQLISNAAFLRPLNFFVSHL